MSSSLVVRQTKREKSSELKVYFSAELIPFISLHKTDREDTGSGARLFTVLFITFESFVVANKSQPFIFFFFFLKRGNIWGEKNLDVTDLSFFHLKNEFRANSGFLER